MADFRALCAELLASYEDSFIISDPSDDPLVQQARAALAQPEPEAPTDEELRRRFLIWWREEGSAMRPHPEHDHEEHARLVSEIAWANGAYVARWGHVTQQGCTQLP